MQKIIDELQKYRKHSGNTDISEKNYEYNISEDEITEK